MRAASAPAAPSVIKTGRVAVAIYDGNCKLCRSFASILRKSVSHELLDVVACDTPIQLKLAPEVPPEICRAAFTLVEPSGRVLTGGQAAAAVAAMSPKVASYRWMIESVPGNWLARTVYGVLGILRGKRRRCGGCGKTRRRNTPS